MKLRKKMLIVPPVAAMLLGGGIALAAWNVTGSGAGNAKAGSSLALTTTVAAPAADLYPGASNQPLYLVVHNPNPFPVTVTNVNPNGTVTSDSPACDTGGNGVSFAAQSGLTQAIAAGGSATFQTAGGVSMASSSDNACQGATFSVPVTLTAVSA